MIKYSIMIITYNQKKILSKTLRSIAKQINNPKLFEIVIADDCSTDGTEEFVKKQRLPIFMKYIRSEKNVGRSIIRNMGFKKTVGEQVLFLDGDMEPSPDMIAAYLKSWEIHPNAVIVGAWKTPKELESNRVLQYILARGRFRQNEDGPIRGKYFNSGNFSVRKEVFEKLSGFDLDFEGWKGEDTDFGLRLEKEHVPIRYNPDAVSFHYHSKTLAEMESEYERFGRTSYKILLKKHGASAIFKNGWIVGLPDPDIGLLKRSIRWFLSPFMSETAISTLKKIASLKGGEYSFGFFYSWLLFGCMLRGYKKIK